MISLNNARLMRAEHTLLDDTSLSIHKGQKIGVIGRNGTGKSSLFACLSGELALDQGELLMPADLRVAQMRQETAGSQRTAREYVMDGDADYRRLEAKLQAAEASGDNNAMARLHGEMDRIGGYDIQARAEQLLSGLGFSVDQFGKALAEFSGGWRIRLNLAAALMAPSDLLLLDEPTNHLDLEATLWLEQWLNRYQGTLLIISHDRSFLDKVIDHVISFDNRQLVMYRGNYSAYEVQRAERLAQQQAMAEKQLRRRAEIEDFVRRFRAKASKARQAQSRLKELHRMQDIAPAHIDSDTDFRFPPAERTADELLALDKAAIGFGNTALIENIRLRILSGTRIGLLGLNGSGKSTLLKTLSGQVPLIGGEMNTSRHLNTGYFAQHQVDVLDGRLSAMALMQQVDARAREQELRNFLGGFDFRGDRVNEPITHFSGGEKARLALALVAWKKPNLLLLDEPTNHLDMEMRHALTIALQAYEGAMMVVSHDRYLLDNTVDEFYVIHNGRFSEFDGTLDDYAQWLQKQQAADNNTAGNALPTAGNGNGTASRTPDTGNRADKKAQRQEAAARREQLAPLRKAARQLEQQMGRINERLADIEAIIADPVMYDEQKKAELADLLLEQGKLRRELEQVEERWLEAAEILEAG